MSEPSEKPLEPSDQLDFAWRAHEANVNWVRGIDQKASIFLVVALTLTGVFARQALDNQGTLAHVSGLRLAVTIIAGALLVAATALALWVVRPSLHARHARRQAGQGLIYFGHLRFRDAGEIEPALADLTPGEARADLARQLEAHGRLSWRKHWRLQRSLESLVAGAAAFALAQFVL